MTEAEFLAAMAEANALLWFHARRLAGGGTVPAEDLVQAAALWLWANRHKLRAGHPNPGGWFIQAGRWAMLRHLEREARQRAGRLDPDANPAAIAAADPEPDEFDTLVELVPADRRELVRERFAGGRTYEDLAATSGVTPGAVRLRLETVLGRLRERLTG